ncbi:MAG: M56 family metallopeptidase [Bacteroidaceae bacterium]|nr:M56 family metallopeptidase [Bacteroidaceae bacterium]
MIYLVVSAFSLALMLVVYRLTLSRTTFHGFNRGVLLCSLALAALVPFVHFQSVSGKAAAPITYMMNEIMVYADASAQMNPGQTVQAAGSVSWASVLTLVYMAGVIICLFRVAIGVLSSEIICHRRSRTLADGSRLVITDRNYAPFSWRNYIVISRKDYEAGGAMIITHEQAHVRHHHSFDLILAQLFCAFQWFNPAAWMLKRSLMEVHEYEADASVLESGFDERRYQICLVRAALQGSFATTTNNFANCSTKKRIVMMNRHSTNPWARLRVLLMLPAVALSVTVASASNQDVKVAEKQNLTAVIIEEKNGKVDSSSINLPAAPDDVFMVVEDVPEFPGGAAALLEFLRKNINYPTECRKNRVEGRVLVSFIVEKDGSITNPFITLGADPLLDAEALRVVSLMPNWKPGYQRGEAVRVQYTVPINFRLSKD